MKKQPLQVLLAKPRGFCAGVVRAIDIVERALIKFDEPVYVRHEIVHNKTVVQKLKAKGAIFVEELDEIPDGAVTIFSAHGVSRKVENGAVQNPVFRVYRVPQFADVPETEVYLADTSDTVGPFGAKSMSESPYNPVAPAIGNAIARALGKRPFHQPFTRQRVWRLAQHPETAPTRTAE